jgi:hypothetical protein
VSKITIREPIQLIVGPIRIYKKINCSIVWVPQAMGDSTLFKQVREATFIFENDAFTSAVASYISDVSMDYEEVDFFEQFNQHNSFVQEEIKESFQ